MRGTVEAQEEVVKADEAVWGKAGAHSREIDRAVVLVNLDGVAAAEGDVGASDACEVGEDALTAYGAGGVRTAGVDLAVLVGPEIVREESAAHEMWLVGEELEGLGGLERGGQVDGGGEDAGGVTSFDGAGGWLGEDAGEARGRSVVGSFCGSHVVAFRPWGQMRGSFVLRGMAVVYGGCSRLGKDVHGGGVGADSGGIDPGFGLLDCIVIYEVAGFEVVGCVENEVGRGEEFVDVGGDEICDVGVDGNGGVEERDFAAGGFGFGEGFEGVGLVEEYLSLEVGRFYEVAVDEGEGANAGTGQERSCGGSGSPDADDGDVGGGKQVLAESADAGEEDLTGVAVLIRDGLGDGETGGYGASCGISRCRGGIGGRGVWMLRHDEGRSTKRRSCFVV
jgi:hypothetical protein